MNALAQHHLALGARLAPDQIPLHYGDLSAEFESALTAAVLLDRSHEGRILLSGPDSLTLVNRMSTNDVAALAMNEGCATVFTNANARILFRATCFLRPEGLLLISEAGQGAGLAEFLRRNIFFGDQVSAKDISAATAQFAIHGPGAKDCIQALDSSLADLPMMGSGLTEVAGCQLTLARRRPICGEHWLVICAAEHSSMIHQHLLRVGATLAIKPAGSLTYNALRIRSGKPAGLELSADYLPLEVGLWDEISFSKGCYTGQEIIARMESRGRLAKTIVKLDLARMVTAPATISVGGRRIGVLTSSVKAADGVIYALAVIKLDYARPGSSLSVGQEEVPAQVKDFGGIQPPYVQQLVQQQ